MSIFNDDEMNLILGFIHEQSDRNSFALVCKQWLKVEGLNRFSIQVYLPEFLQNFLPRFPNLLAFTSPALLTDAHLEFVAKTCPKLETLNLNVKQSDKDFDEFGFKSGLNDVGDEGVRAIANGCPNLSKVYLKRRNNIGNLGVVSIVGNVNIAPNLTCLDIRRCTLIDDSALEAIGKLSTILVLKLDGCSLITDKGLVFLAQGSCSKSLKTLFVAECDRLTDYGVSQLEKMCCLEELSLAKCGHKVTDVSGRAIASIETLKILDLSWLINISDITIYAIAEYCKDLVELSLKGCGNITGMSLYGFRNHEHLKSLALPSSYAISWDDLEVVLQCKSLKSVLIGEGYRGWLPGTIVRHIIAGRVHWW